MQKLFTEFCHLIWDHYRKYGRSFSWRKTTDPYAIVVSEIMLQQTQTSRVEQKFTPFMQAFPTFKKLAEASFEEVLCYWVGLGYNRRARALYEIARCVTNTFGGNLPEDVKTLVTFKGLGPATASSIIAFAFNKPTVFIETNIRAVFLHCFFATEESVSDKQLFPYIEATVDQQNPREWYYALMDYGVMLKKQHQNPSRKSKHHAIQSKFKGSRREVRGAVLKYLVEKNNIQKEKLLTLLPFEKQKIESVLSDLQQEGFIVNIDSKISIS